MAKILLVSRCSWTLYNFRKELIEELAANGDTVIGAGAGGDGFEDSIERLGTPFVNLPVAKQTLNPLKDLLLLVHLYRWYRKERPALVHHFTIKPVIYGSIAARLARVPTVINTVPGLGFAFTREAPRWLQPLVEALYKLALRKSDFTFFQNRDDRQLFVDHHLVDPHKTAIAPEWVDTARFAPQELGTAAQPGICFIMVARLLREKGVSEYIEAARRVKAQIPDARFQLLGGRDDRNPHVIPQADLDDWVAEGCIQWLGVTDDVRRAIAEADVVVLPSYYREGSPRSLMEASSMAKPIITTDNVGCRDVVTDGENGLLVPVRDAGALSNAMLKLIHSPELRNSLGAAGRKRALREFDSAVVVRQITDVYQKASL